MKEFKTNTDSANQLQRVHALPAFGPEFADCTGKGDIRYWQKRVRKTARFAIEAGTRG